MSDLVAIVYPSEAKAEEVRQGLLELQREHLITIADAVTAVKTDKDSVKLQHDYITAVDSRTFPKEVSLGAFLAAGGVAVLGGTARQAAPSTAISNSESGRLDFVGQQIVAANPRCRLHRRWRNVQRRQAHAQL